MFKSVTKKGITLAMASVLLVGVVAGCGSKGTGSTTSPAATTTPAAATATPAATTATVEGTVTASGSSALLPLVKEAAKLFMDANAKVTVNPTAGGSGAGLKNVADGTSNIGNSDVEAGKAYDGKGLVDHVVAIAPFVLIVSKDVTVDSLTKQQATDIFTGKITNWKQVGGNDQKISIIQRAEGSGSRTLVQNLVLGGAVFTKDGVVTDASGSMKTAVAQGQGAIGYIDVPYVDGTLKALKFDGVAYTKEGIKDGSYKLFGIEHMYTKGEPTGAVKAFLDYIMSADFQGTKVEALKFLPANFLSK
jgi:phosphate transport system substrate-binding protein